MGFVIGIPLLALYVAHFNGLSGTAFYFDSFWSPALLALLLEPASDEQKRTLSKILLGVVILNVIIGLIESITHYNWFPFIPPVPELASKLAPVDDDFRANAFYTHPLGASLVTSLGIFLLYNMRLKLVIAGPIFALLMLGLLEFGGRTALAVTLLVSAMAAIYTLVSGLIRRDLKLDFVMTVVVAVVLLPILATFIITQTSIADRIINTLYFDGSARVRTMQWTVLNYLNLKEWLFGITLKDVEALKYQIGLDAVEDIENFWLLLFLNLGAIGFVVFLILFGGFLVHVARAGKGLNAWLLSLAAIAIDSGANSLGEKSNDLFMQVAFVIAMSGYAGYVRSPAKIVARLRVGRTQDGPLRPQVMQQDRGLRQLGPVVNRPRPT